MVEPLGRRSIEAPQGAGIGVPACPTILVSKSDKRTGARSITGFTLIEMLVAITIVGIMAAIAIPSFLSVMTSMRMSGEINELQRGFNLARSEAIKRGQSVSVCPGTAASTACGTGTDWSAGWIVFLPSTAVPLLVSPGVTHGDTLTNSLATNPTFTQGGYTFFSGTMTLHDSASTQSLYQCIAFSAGSWTIQTGAACP